MEYEALNLTKVEPISKGTLSIQAPSGRKVMIWDSNDNDKCSVWTGERYVYLEDLVSRLDEDKNAS